MTFVFPILLGGLFAAGVPILLHLIMRQKPKTLPFPAFRFLVQRQRTNLRKLQLRHLLLLALRVLLIVLLCLALVRPRLTSEGLNLNSERPVAAVLVFDTSLSMEYQTSNKKTRLEEAKERGQEFLKELPSGSLVLVLDTGDTLTSGRGDWLASKDQARGRIDKLVPRPASVSALQTLAYAYRLLGELARSTDDEMRRYLPRFVCVFSDRTRACWELGQMPAAQTAADQVPSSLEGLLKARADIAPLVSQLKELRGKLPPPPGRDYPELALIEALDRLSPLLPSLTKADFPPDEKLSALTETIQRRGRDLLDILQTPNGKEDKKESEPFRIQLIKSLQDLLRDVRGAQGLFVDVGIDEPVDFAIIGLELPVLAGGQPREVFGADEKILLQATVLATGKRVSTTVACLIDGNRIAQQPVDVEAGQRQTVPFEIDAAAPGAHQIEVRVDPPDLLPFNNRRVATFAIREPRRVLVLTDNPGAADKFVATLQLKAKLLGFAVDVKATRELRDIDNPLVYRAVYLFEVPDPDATVWSFLLENFVQRGIGLGIIPSADTNIDSYNNDVGAQKLMPGKLVRIEYQGKDGGPDPGATWNFTDDNVFQHPLMKPFRDWRQFDVVKFPREAFAFWDVTPRDKEALVVVSYNALDKAGKNVKKPAILERFLPTNDTKPGKILLLTTPLSERKPRWNNYLESTNSMYVVLVGLVTNYLAGATEAPKLNFIAGQDEPVVDLPPTARFPTLSLRRDKDPNAVEVAVPEKQSQLKLPQAQEPGNYLLTGPKERVAAFSVNVPAAESDLTRVPISEIESLFGPGAVIPVARKANIREALQGHWSEPFELFPLFMVILLLFLAVENLLANKFYRRDDKEGERRES